MWSSWKVEPAKPDYNPNRKVTLTIEQLTDALADALAEARWKRGDRAYVEVEVTGLQHEGAHISVSTVDTKTKRSFDVPAYALKEIA